MLNGRMTAAILWRTAADFHASQQICGKMRVDAATS